MTAVRPETTGTRVEHLTDVDARPNGPCVRSRSIKVTVISRGVRPARRRQLIEVGLPAVEFGVQFRPPLVAVSVFEVGADLEDSSAGPDHRSR